MVNTYKVLTITFAILLLSLTLASAYIQSLAAIEEQYTQTYSSPVGTSCTGQNGDKMIYKHAGSTQCDKMECRNQLGGPVWVKYQTCAGGCRDSANAATLPCA